MLVKNYTLEKVGTGKGLPWMDFFRNAIFLVHCIQMRKEIISTLDYFFLQHFCGPLLAEKKTNTFLSAGIH